MQPREDAVKFTGRRMVDPYQCVFLGLVGGRHTTFGLFRDQSRATGETISATYSYPRSCKTSFRIGPTEFWRTTVDVTTLRAVLEALRA